MPPQHLGEKRHRHDEKQFLHIDQLARGITEMQSGHTFPIMITVTAVIASHSRPNTRVSKTGGLSSRSY